MSHFVGIVFGPKEELTNKLFIYLNKFKYWEIGGKWSGEILHAGSYDTNQAQKEYLSSIDTPYCFIDLDGNWHEKYNPIEWEKEFREYLDSISDDIWLTVIDFHV